MNSQQVIDKLGYSDSPAFLHGERLREHHGYSFLFSQAEREERCNLKGVYTLAPPGEAVSNRSLTPVVYVCEADNEKQAQKIHRRVWNQNIVPFLIVVTRKNVRLYSGFEYDRSKSDQERVLQIARTANEVLNKLSAFTSEAIDSGDIWDRHKVATESRVDRDLLKNLNKLSEKLTGREYRLPVKHAHTLIGKYIYLKYLRDRDILSDRRLSDAGLCEEDVFSRAAKKEALYQLEDYLDIFLNGSVFPLPRKDIETEHIKEVAGAFKGGDPESGQDVLFDIYDFSYVPIETLSVVYQQFLHQKGEGRSKGAYYTPVHLVNFILDELDAKEPLREGMKVFDPSCGSGAFLVQCYRRLVESVVKRDGRLKPTELRCLLTEHVFGLDADEAACRVAELSLSLTLLDYIDPPDLSKTNFKLPDLHNQNIFHCEGGFFDDDSLWAKSMAKQGYHWIVGNPPWRNIDKKKDKEPYDVTAIGWIDAKKDQCPVDNYQIAEAFAWKTTEFLTEGGQCGFLMPAMTLFKKQGDRFRASFFSNTEVWCVVNFANIRRYLFEKAINPAAAFFYSGKKDWDKANHYITTYAPFAVEEASQLNEKERSKRLWTVFVNYSSIREIPLCDVKCGSSAPWKIAMWGTHRDKLLINGIRKRWPVELSDYIEENELTVSQGLEWRDEVPESDPVELANEIRGKYILRMAKLKGVSDTHSFGQDVLETIPKGNDIYVRKGRKNLPLSICKPPHIIIDECRRMAVYSFKFIVVPPMQIGISGKANQQKLLKTLTLYVKSNVAYYLQFWTTPKMGIERDIFNLNDLKGLPVALSSLSDREVSEWAKLHDAIVEAEERERKYQDEEKTPLFNTRRRTSSVPLSDLLKKMNDKVYKLLGIKNRKQRWLIEDTLNVRLKLNDGRVAKEATKLAREKEIRDFVRIFQDELDLFLDHSGKKKVHKVKVLYADKSAVMIVDHLKRSTISTPEVTEVHDGEIRHELEAVGKRLREERSQWMYFTRCLRLYERRRTYIFKPRQRLYWLKSQALAEADEFIAEKLATEH